MEKQSVAQWLTQLQSDGIHLTVGELIRYQQLTRLMDLRPRSMTKAKLAGTYLAKHKGRGMEFDEARHYLPGDDIRAIDWRVTARTGKTHTKVYREERERPVFVLCDLSSSMQFGSQLLLKAVQAAHLTALIGWSAAARGDKIGALLFNNISHRECKPLSRKRAVLSICHELIEVHHSAQQTNRQSSPNASPEAFAEACARIRRLAKPGSLVYLISDFADITEVAKQHLTQVGRHCEVHAVMINDPLELALPQVNSVQPVSVTDGAQRQTWILGDTSQQEEYVNWRQQHTRNVSDLLRQTRVRLHQVSAGTPLDEQLSMLTAGGR